MQLHEPLWLLLLLLIPALHRWWVNKNRPAHVQFSWSLSNLSLKMNPVQSLLFVRYLGLFFLVLALARPQISYTQRERSVEGIDIILTMDVSASMNATDLSDDTRFNVAKKTLQDFVQGRVSDRIGFVIFSGEAVTLAPVTLDYGLVLQAIASAKIGELRDGTAIGDGLALAVNRLKESRAKSRVIILLTDGDNNVGKIDPATAGDLAAGYGIRVYSIAIGRDGPIRIPVTQTGAFGQKIVTYSVINQALNPEILMKISEMTKAKFYRVTDADMLNQVFKDIDSLEKTEVKTKERVQSEERFLIPLLLGLFLLILERILSIGVWRLVT